ncbi:hypothetical protein BVRB_025570, partial [Beta vulgaris subsp. vulgaris]
MKSFLNGAVASLSLFSIYAQAQDTLDRIQITPESDRCEAAQIEEYSIAWHVAGIFIVMVSSGIGVFTTLSLGTRARKPSIARILQVR